MPTLTRDGVSLAYEEAGRGAQPLLFVHGWCCDRSYFAPQFEYFQRSHRVVSVDLRGHGESDRPIQEYTVDGFADDLAWMCDALDLRGSIVIGHSLGGLVALTFATRYQGRASAVAMLDMPTIPFNGRLPDDHPLWQTSASFRGPDFRQAAAQYVDGMFLPTDDPERRAQITAGMLNAPQHVLTSSFANAWECDLISAATACTIPAVYIDASRGSAGVERFSELCPQLIVGRTVGAGHFHQLEVPDQINAMLERFISIASGS